jgi:hypothetical protein
MGFDIRTADLRAINSLTQYPSIPTYHALDPRHGTLRDQTVAFTGQVIGTEKVDGTNARIIWVPDDGTWLLGSRAELLYARGDLIGNPAQGIVDALRGTAERLGIEVTGAILVFYLEVYGGKTTPAAKHYTDDRSVGYRLFDVAQISDYEEVLSWPGERIAAWRDAGGQPYYTEKDLVTTSISEHLPLVPRLFTIDAADLPTDIAQMREFLDEHAPATRAALGEAPAGPAEGIVLRTTDRSVIAKARFQDYDRTLKRRGPATRR